MAERLTEHKTRKGVTEIVVKPCVDINIVIHKLCLLEDIMEKYGVESVEKLEKLITKMNLIVTLPSPYRKLKTLNSDFL